MGHVYSLYRYWIGSTALFSDYSIDYNIQSHLIHRIHPVRRSRRVLQQHRMLYRSRTRHTRQLTAHRSHAWSHDRTARATHTTARLGLIHSQPSECASPGSLATCDRRALPVFAHLHLRPGAGYSVVRTCRCGATHAAPRRLVHASHALRSRYTVLEMGYRPSTRRGFPPRAGDSGRCRRMSDAATEGDEATRAQGSADAPSGRKRTPAGNTRAAAPRCRGTV